MKKLIAALLLSNFLLAGCFSNNSSDEVIKVTSPKTPVKNGKKLSLSTGVTLMQENKTDEAINFFLDYKDFFSNDFNYFNYLGDAYVKKSKLLKAISAYEKSLALNENQPQILLKIADCHEKTNSEKKASEFYIKYIFESGDVSQNKAIREKLNKIATYSTGQGLIKQFFVTSKTSPEIAFDEDIPEIFAKIELIKPKTTDKIELQWKYTTSTGEIISVNSAKLSEISANQITSSLKAPLAGWPKGKYILNIVLNGEANSSCDFYIF